MIEAVSYCLHRKRLSVTPVSQVGLTSDFAGTVADGNRCRKGACQPAVSERDRSGVDVGGSGSKGPPRPGMWRNYDMGPVRSADPHGLGAGSRAESWAKKSRRGVAWRSPPHVDPVGRSLRGIRAGGGSGGGDGLPLAPMGAASGCSFKYAAECIELNSANTFRPSW